MKLFSSCPDCKLALRLLAPEPAGYGESRLLMQSLEILPLLLHRQARWLGRCPECQAELVPLSCAVDRKNADHLQVSVARLRAYRAQREGALRELGARHLAEAMGRSFLPGWILSCVVGLLWGLWSLRFGLLWVACGSVFVLGIAFLELSQNRFAPLIKRISKEFVAFFGWVGWLSVASLLGQTELFLALGAWLPGMAFALYGVLRRMDADALLYAEQELLQLRPLPMEPRYYTKVTDPYRGMASM